MFFRLILSALILVGTASAQAPSAVGDWQGILDAGAQKLRLVFHIQQGDADTLTATMDSLDQGAMGIPVNSVLLENRNLTIRMPNIGMSYSGELSGNGQQIAGTFRQGGGELPLTLHRQTASERTAAKPVRSQIPLKPYPYEEQDVEFENPAASGVRIACTLTSPRGDGSFPAVSLLSGSGPHKRDQENFGHPLGLVLADFLTRKGIAVLRCDDRGVGKSAAPRETLSSITYQDMASDASAMVNYLKENKKVNARKIGLIGHSEGGVVAPLAATSNADVSFLILLAGLGVTGETSILAQKQAVLRANGVASPDISVDRAVYQAILSGADEQTVRKTASPMVASMPSTAQENYFRTILSPYWKFMLAYDPIPTLERLEVPVLALFGEKDIQVLPELNAQPMREVAEKAQDQRITVKILPGLNHLFQPSSTGSLAEYGQIEETISPVVLDYMNEWLMRILK